MNDQLQDGDLRLLFEQEAEHPAHHVPTLHYSIWRFDNVEVGTIRLRLGSTRHVEQYAGHIGYAIHPEHRGHRYAAQAVRLLIPIAQQRGFGELWITCDPENIASRRTCELAGAEFVEIVDVPETCIIHRTGHPRKCRFRLRLTRDI